MKNKICNIITMVLCVLVPLCIFLPLINIDTSPITVPISKIFGDIEIWDDGLKYSTVDIIKHLADYKEDLGSYSSIFIGLITIQCIFPVVIFGLSWLKTRVKYIINAVLAAVTLGLQFAIHMALIPQQIEKMVHDMIDESIAGEMLSVLHLGGLTDEVAEQMGKAYKESLYLGFYIPIVILALVIVASIVGFILYQQVQTAPVGAPPFQINKGSSNTVQRRGNAPVYAAAQASIVGLSGMYKGATIPLTPGEALTIGRDPAQCNVIIEAEAISRKHCTISFDAITGQYKVTDYSSNGTFINNERRVMRNQTQFVQRGEVISVGGSENSFRLS